MSDTPGAPSSSTRQPGKAPADRTEQVRRVVALVLAALVVLFAVLNFDSVEVNWIIGTWETPLIVVIVLSAVLGAVADRAVQYRSRRRAPRRA